MPECQLAYQAARFATIDNLMTQIDSGSLTVDVIDGVEHVTYYDLFAQRDCKLVPALLDWIAFMGEMCRRKMQPPHTYFHSKVASHLANAQLLTPDLINGMRAEIEKHKAIYRTTTKDLRAEVATCIGIKKEYGLVGSLA
ncbi:hypothetical protein DKK66_20105 (plasmid) [Aquitalea sp. USM4]|nr:hypothetical protein DKK66_20105 [Aquitalea sp. USM4]